MQELVGSYRGRIEGPKWVFPATIDRSAEVAKSSQAHNVHTNRE